MNDCFLKISSLLLGVSCIRQLSGNIHIYIYIYIYIHWRSKRIHHSEVIDGETVNNVTNLIRTSNYTENKQKTNFNI